MINAISLLITVLVLLAPLILMIVGALPKQGRLFLYDLFEWWPERIMAMVSEFLEFFFGVGMIRFGIMARDTGDFSGSRAMTWGILGSFFALEGLFRLAANTAIKDSAVPSVILWLVFRVGRFLADRVPQRG